MIRIFFDPNILSYTYSVRNIHKIFRDIQKKHHKQPYIYRLATNNPRNPINKANKFESDLIKLFSDTNLDIYTDVIKENNNKYYLKAVPIYNQKSCLECHSTPDKAPKDLVKRYGDKAGFGEKVGKVRAIMILKTPVTQMFKTSEIVFLTIAGILFLSFLVFYILILQIIKRDNKLKKLNDNLEKRIEQEVSKNLDKDRFMRTQAKRAAMGEMIGSIAHQWKQPLNSLGLNIQNLKYEYEDKNIDESFIEEYIKHNQKTIKFMSETINDFRNFFRVDKTKTNFSIRHAINTTINILDASFKAHNITVKINGDDFEIYGVEGEFEQVILNILSNAKDALVSQDGFKDLKIVINIEDKKLSIEDNAGGISEAVIDKIFDPYFTTKSKDKGTGMGLNMSKIIIQEHFDAKLSATNGKYGARFEIDFTL